MSGDEIFITVISAVLSLMFWGYWYAVASTVFAFTGGYTARRILLITPLVCVAILYFILRRLASFDVQEDYRYIAMYLTMGLAWIGMNMTLSPYLGIIPRDDAVERRNLAAAIAISGAMLGILLCFAGGNIGDGPGWWVVVFCALLSTAALFLLWTILEMAGRVSEVITVDRDTSAGLRLGAFLTAAGLILGRAVAGDWVSTEATFRDFLQTAWPILLLLVVAIAIERALRPNRENPVRPSLSAGLVPAALYLVAAAYYVLGWLEQP
jgi:uncharacterized membrane protein YjfL (UPF0719 family)